MSQHTARQSARSRWNPRLPIALSGSPDLLTASTRLVRHDIPVFPCTPGAKQPLTSHGFHDASTDVAVVRDWWQRWPDANIGMPTGAASGVDVVDVDVHAGGNGFAAFEGARSVGLAEGWAWLVRTPSGGVHAYYLRFGGDDQRSWQVPDRHVDFRGDGGYIIAPPSCITAADGQSRSYELIAVAQHRAAPVDAAALRSFLEPPCPTRPPSRMPALGQRSETLAAWVASRPEGARNHGLFWAACRMAEEGHSLDVAFRLLGDAARAAGLSDAEAQTTLRSAFRTTSRLGTATAAHPTSAEAVRM